MNNYALIFAGGTGQRMNSKSLPKQFLLVHGKPIIVHTLLHFENSNQIKGIVVVCYEPYIATLKKLLKEFNVKKVIDIIAGGNSGQQSIFLGLERLSKVANDDDIVLIHDGVRPVIDGELIKNNIECVQQYGNAITVSHAIETVITTNNDKISNVANREQCYHAKAPQSFYFKDIYGCHLKANAEHNDKFIDSATMAYYYGFELHTVLCSSENIKITTPIDFYMFKALLDAKETAQIKLF